MFTAFHVPFRISTWTGESNLNYALLAYQSGTLETRTWVLKAPVSIQMPIPKDVSWMGGALPTSVKASFERSSSSYFYIFGRKLDESSSVVVEQTSTK